MPPLKKHDKEYLYDEYPMRMRLLSLLLMITGPLFLVFVNLRCEKNQCVLLQFPMVVPTHFSAYFSINAALLMGSFFCIMLLVNRFSTSDQIRGRRREFSSSPVSPTSGFLLGLSMLMACVAYIKPEYILKVRAEYLRLLCTTIVFSYVFSFGLALLYKIFYTSRERDYCFPMGFFHGYNSKVKLGKVNLKYYFYVNVGMVLWALMDLLIFISYVLEKPVTAPLIFIFSTQYIFVLHTLLYEKFLVDRPFMYTEGLGFSWLMRVLLFTPFLFSLPLLYASATEITIPKPAMLANCGLFMFGFVIYVSSLHQRESFNTSLSSQKSMKTITTNTGRRLLVGGYWGTVQKPDYLGYLVMWLSWTVACGFSAVSFIVLLIVCATVLFWLHQRDHYHRERHGSAWNRYTAHVPHKIIPMFY